MKCVNAHRAGLSIAAVLAGWHAVWILLVAGGVAQKVLDFAFAMHGMKSDAVVSGLDPGLAATLLLVTAGVGYVSGFVAAWVWDCLQGCRV